MDDTYGIITGHPDPHTCHPAIYYTFGTASQTGLVAMAATTDSSSDDKLLEPLFQVFQDFCKEDADQVRYIPGLHLTQVS